MHTTRPQFSSTYQLVMATPMYKEFISTLRDVESDAANGFQRVSNGRTIVSISDEFTLEKPEQLTLNFNEKNKISTGDICSFSMETNQTDHEKTKDLSLFFKLKEQCKDVFPQFATMLGELINTMDMSNQRVTQFKFNSLIGECGVSSASARVQTIPAQVLKDVNALRVHF